MRKSVRAVVDSRGDLVGFSLTGFEGRSNGAEGSAKMIATEGQRIVEFDVPQHIEMSNVHAFVTKALERRPKSPKVSASKKKR